MFNRDGAPRPGKLRLHIDVSPTDRDQEAELTRLPALLVDQLDKSDIDLPNDLLSVFEEGEFAILGLTEGLRLVCRFSRGRTTKRLMAG